MTCTSISVSPSPAVTRTFDLGLMTRIAVGPGWAQLGPTQQQRLTTAFSRYTISNYASRFDDYGGESFEVDPTPVANPNGSVVQSRIVKSNGEKVSLNYLMRRGGDGNWKISCTWSRMYSEQVITRRASYVSHHSTWWMSLFIGPGRYP